MRTPGDDEDLVAGCCTPKASSAASQPIVVSRACRARRTLGRIAPIACTSRVAPGVDVAAALGARALSGDERVRTVRTAAHPGARSRPRCAPGRPASARRRCDLQPAGRAARGQRAFAETGGLHAAALFNAAGERRVVREDVGRHNAVDKVVGAAFAAGASAGDGRGARRERPRRVRDRAEGRDGRRRGASSRSARRRASPSRPRARPGLTLVGFARDGRFNVYAGERRDRRRDVRRAALLQARKISDERVQIGVAEVVLARRHLDRRLARLGGFHLDACA